MLKCDSKAKAKKHKAKLFTFYFLLLTSYFLSPSLSRAQPDTSESSRDIRLKSSTDAHSKSSVKALFSPATGQNFYEIAYELANSEKTNEQQVEQALVLMTATMSVDSRASYVLPDMIKLACRYPQHDYSELVRQMLISYTDDKADLEVVREAVRYLLEQLNSREQREQLLKDMLKSIGSKNSVLASELATLLGLLAAEKADLETAQSHFIQAYNSDKYNKTAFAKLTELAPEQVNPAMHLEHIRLALRENPLDMETALGFAQYAQQLQLYQTSADGYEYCADLFRFLNQSEPLPAHIYLPWAISSYNTQRNRHKCLEIAEQLRQSGRFDIRLEALAARAAAKIGGLEQAEQIFRAAEEKINTCPERPVVSVVEPSRRNQSSIPVLSEVEGINHQSIAWFYCFGFPDANNALNWANKAYSTEPNSATAAGLLAYSLVMNGQTDLAELLISNYEQNQTATLAMARIQLAKGQKDSAIETLKSVIAKDPGSLQAELAKEILAEHGGEYIPSIEHNITLTALENSFGQTLVPKFVSSDKIVSVQFNVRGSKFSYGSKFGGTLAITNHSAEPLIISDDGLLGGNIRVDARISGDIRKDIPNLVSIKIRPTLPIEPGRSIIIPLRLLTAELKKILLTYPQASLDIEFTAYLDPVTDDQGKPTNKLSDIKPAGVVVKRPGVEITGKYLRSRFNSLSKGWQGQKTKTIELFIGLLMEQHAMADSEPLYKFRYADWMPALLKSALLRSITDDDWVARVHTMTSMLSLPLDYEFIDAVAENLNDADWPARLIAVYLLAKNQPGSFGKVLDYTAKYDSNKLVRDMASALGGAGGDQAEQ